MPEQADGYPSPPKRPIDDRDVGNEGRGRTALVTGASAGIGLAMSELLAAKGYTVLIVARREQRLVAIAEQLRSSWGAQVHTIVADLNDPLAPMAITKSVADLGLGVDFLVNNAGFSEIGRYDTLPWEVHEKHFRVMGTATLELTHRLISPMVERGWGRIINVASISSLLNATPGEAMYGATKAMVRSFSEAVDAEFRDFGVRCTVSMPGFTETEIYELSGFGEEIAENRLYSAMYNKAVMSPATVARQAYGAAMAGRPSIVHGVHHKALGAILLHTPLSVRRYICNALSPGPDA